ncbi:alpha/beta hydrolase [Rhodococcus sp. 06-462-5]|uniref:alpha/beta fold hydrolase n=1 Tax=unclassified Rhodococcus (in: high G+C Gram-positive bacteria) TaxID=192944 RepID=UPI000B9C4151|nr:MULTISPECIES: alpha/beta hydrolase [unclassified Rhodococcus (in: high G+C Gram-positive bacteria)]OZC73625.1 alpha/beta hydrolase [Rhodococcus sp. 06-462-5]OZE63434.1 alpha/beta hydrolase [Rhodococcus sp. 02-925g]
MSKQFSDQQWWDRFLQTINEDLEWVTSSQHFSATISFRSPEHAWTIDTRNGRAVSVVEGIPLSGSDVVLDAPEHEWQRVIEGKTDWFEGTSPGLGEITVSGDYVAAMRNVQPMWRLLECMQQVDPILREDSSFSPDPVVTDRVPVGRYVNVDGLRTYYEEAGSGQPIVCIHAAGQDTMMYRWVTTGLSDHYRVISVDAPGHGKTLEPEGGAFTSLAQHAEFNEKFMAALGLERPIIVGCSMGGNMVLDLAARRPNFYAGVISCEGSDYTPTVSQDFLAMLTLNSPQILECWARSMTGDRTPPARAREVVWQLRRVCPEVIRADLTGYAGFDRRDTVGAIESPVLLLRGDADWLVHQDMVEATQSRIPGSEIAVLAGTGHYPMIENPVEFNDAVRTFADRVS